MENILWQKPKKSLGTGTSIRSKCTLFLIKKEKQEYTCYITAGVLWKSIGTVKTLEEAKKKINEHK